MESSNIECEDNIKENNTSKENTKVGNTSKTNATTDKHNKRKNASSVWLHFETLPEGSVPDVTDDYRRGKCKHCDIIQITDSRYGTNNMRRHINSCPKLNFQDVRQMLLNGGTTVRSPKLNQLVYREKLAEAITKHEHPFSFVEQEGIRELHAYLNPDVKCISRNTARADVMKMYAKEKEKMFAVLGSIPGRVCLTSDLWTSITSDGYICITCHFIDDQWKLHKKILNFCYMPPPHSGIAITEKISSLLSKWDIEKKLFTITLDNASSNYAFIDKYKSRLNLRKALLLNGQYLHVRCCTHIINLIVYEGLKEISKAIEMARDSVRFVKGSQSRKKKLVECATEYNLNTKKGLSQDVHTRWNSTYLMLDSVLYYRIAFCHLALVDPHYTLCPSEDEWLQIEKLCKFLKVFYDVTNIFSGTLYPTANLYFHGVWKIQSRLKEEAESPDIFTRSVAERMQIKFDKYWKDTSDILSIAVILDPRYKMKVVEFAFTTLYGSNEGSTKVAVIRKKIFDLFKEYCPQPIYDCTTTLTQPMEEDTDDPYSLAYDTFNSDLLGSQSDKSELDVYLEETSYDRKKDLDILEFWKSSQYRFPRLSKMARDVMTIPVSTVASEAAFSAGGRVLDKYRSTLLPESVEALMCTRDWLAKGNVDGDIGQITVPLEDAHMSSAFASASHVPLTIVD